MAELAELRAIWQRAGRPGRDKFRDAVKRSGLNLTVKDAADFDDLIARALDRRADRA